MLQKAITQHSISLFPIVSQLWYQTNWLLGLGELLHDPPRTLTFLTHLFFLPFCCTQSQLAATAVTPSNLEHNVGPMQQSSVQHLTNQMNQLQMSGSQYITSPVHSTFSQASWQMMHQHGQHAHPHYMTAEVRKKKIAKN